VLDRVSAWRLFRRVGFSHEADAMPIRWAHQDEVDFAPRLPARIPSLDGLRAVSISLVILAHVAGSLNLPGPLRHLDHLGNLGVKVFFVISGFLISTLLFKECHATGHVSIKDFYVRRIFRIFPAFYVYYLVIVTAAVGGYISLKPGDAWHAATFTMNYHHDRAWYLNHTWSLSVEEQFYLIWPAMILLAGPRRAIFIAFLTIFLSPLARAYMIFVQSSSDSALTREFQAVADALATGCVLAGVYNWLGRRASYLAFLESRVFLLVPIVCLAAPLGLFMVNASLYYLFGQTIVHIAIALCIDRCLRFPRDRFGVLINSRPFVFVGALSYSLYLWQEPFLNPSSTAATKFTSFPLNVLVTLLAAIASFYLVEKPFLALRTSFRHGAPSAGGAPAPPEAVGCVSVSPTETTG
jgi:peptidoglycan/LPS O-acetylase OafA/YrhL